MTKPAVEEKAPDERATLSRSSWPLIAVLVAVVLIALYIFAFR